MGLNNFVGGRGFSLGKFSKNLNTVSQYGALKNFKEPIFKLVKSRAAAIQGGRFKSMEAMHHLQSEQKPSYAEKKMISSVLKRLENVPNRAIEKISRKEVIDRALKNENIEAKGSTGVRTTVGYQSSEKEKKIAEEKAIEKKLAEEKLTAKEKEEIKEKINAKNRSFKAPLSIRINRAHSEFNQDLGGLTAKQAIRIKERVEKTQKRLKNLTGVSGPVSQIPPGAATSAPHQRINFN